tara:strand:+ start:695 stop:1018 length:324 start_codon:yes stop_codon:yes gene_type:complete
MNTNNVISFPKQTKTKSAEELSIEKEKNRKFMTANAVVESMSRKFLYNIRHYGLDKHLAEDDEELLEMHMNVMLTVIQCVVFKCMDMNHPLDELINEIAIELQEIED